MIVLHRPVLLVLSTPSGPLARDLLTKARLPKVVVPIFGAGR